MKNKNKNICMFYITAEIWSRSRVYYKKYLTKPANKKNNWHFTIVLPAQYAKTLNSVTVSN